MSTGSHAADPRVATTQVAGQTTRHAPHRRFGQHGGDKSGEWYAGGGVGSDDDDVPAFRHQAGCFDAAETRALHVDVDQAADLVGNDDKRIADDQRVDIVDEDGVRAVVADPRNRLVAPARRAWPKKGTRGGWTLAPATERVRNRSLKPRPRSPCGMSSRYTPCAGPIMGVVARAAAARGNCWVPRASTQCRLMGRFVVRAGVRWQRRRGVDADLAFASRGLQSHGERQGRHDGDRIQPVRRNIQGAQDVVALEGPEGGEQRLSVLTELGTGSAADADQAPNAPVECAAGVHGLVQ